MEPEKQNRLLQLTKTYKISLLISGILLVISSVIIFVAMQKITDETQITGLVSFIALFIYLLAQALPIFTAILGIVFIIFGLIKPTPKTFNNFATTTIVLITLTLLIFLTNLKISAIGTIMMAEVPVFGLTLRFSTIFTILTCIYIITFSIFYKVNFKKSLPKTKSTEDHSITA